MAVLERSDQGAVRTITLNRPEARNALNFALLQELRAEFAAAAEADAGVRCPILAGRACKPTDDAKGAMRAAVARRVPVFIGR